MTSNLLMLHPGGSIPFLATSTLAGGTMDTGYTFEDFICGARGNMWRATQGAVSYKIIRNDLGSGVTSAAEYWYIARSDLWYNQLKATTTPRFYLQSATDAAYATAVVRADNTITPNKGPRNEDSFNTISSSGAYRYWQLILDATDGVTLSYHTLSKIQFGVTFDLGRDPEYAIVHRRSMKRIGARDQAFTVDCRWVGITDVKRQSLITSVLAYKDVAPIVLYETTDNIFGGFKLLHVYITDCKITPTSQDQNEITMKFEECI